MGRVRIPLKPLATVGLAWAVAVTSCFAIELPEHELKAAFLYNFARFTEWPAETGPAVTLCAIGGENLDKSLETLRGQPVGARRFAFRRVKDADATQDCQMVFLADNAPVPIARSMRSLLGRRHVLVVGDSPDAARAGVGINMSLRDARVTFEVNRQAVESTGLELSSKLLRLAQNVH